MSIIVCFASVKLFLQSAPNQPTHWSSEGDTDSVTLISLVQISRSSTGTSRTNKFENWINSHHQIDAGPRLDYGMIRAARNPRYSLARLLARSERGPHRQSQCWTNQQAHIWRSLDDAEPEEAGKQRVMMSHASPYNCPLQCALSLVALFMTPTKKCSEVTKFDDREQKRQVRPWKCLQQAAFHSSLC